MNEREERDIEGHLVTIKRDLTSRSKKYYCVVGVSKREVVHGGSIDIVERKVKRLIAKGDISFEPYVETPRESEGDLPDLPF